MNRFLLALLASLSAAAAHAQPTVTDPWVRATVPQQQATGAFMRLRSTEDARLVEVRSPVAGIVELHEMKMEGSVMKMRAVPVIELPAGRDVDFRPGGYHVMLMDLKRQLQVGEQVPLALVIEERGGRRRVVDVTAPVRPLSTPAGGMKMH